ncbi:hypothetical protein [Thalassotalea profundi]|uniref:DUF5666 domain-containing protein n=1 Tax=Thalassotalea profundi TaxID=2036687 RepID=A0ABQ3III8_9GAMM|nr:hypothetical protein [Thalassotalea profundi]GHE81321.1 hypothetical protein GCM10011501_06820 [Thalassotalea profundi]
MNTIKTNLIPLLFILPAPIFAAQNDINIKAIQACSFIENNDNRLHCYDKVVAGSSSPQPTANQKHKPMAETVATQKVPDDFGIEYKEVDKDKGIVVKAKITSITKTLRGKFIITLDNSQVWSQTNSEKIYLKENDTVLIKRGLLSSYKLNKEGQSRSVRVTRTK